MSAHAIVGFVSFLLGRSEGGKRDVGGRIRSKVLRLPQRKGVVYIIRVVRSSTLGGERLGGTGARGGAFTWGLARAGPVLYVFVFLFVKKRKCCEIVGEERLRTSHPLLRVGV